MKGDEIPKCPHGMPLVRRCTPCAHSRASIGPDSERIRKAAEDVERALRAADAGNAGHWPTVALVLADEVRRLRADGLLPGPDDIVVSREVVEFIADHIVGCLQGLDDYQIERAEECLAELVSVLPQVT